MSHRLVSPVYAPGTRSSARIRQRRAEPARASKYFKKVKKEPIGAPGLVENVPELVEKVPEIVHKTPELLRKLEAASIPPAAKDNGPSSAPAIKSEQAIPAVVPAVAKLLDNFSFSRKAPNVFDMVDIEDVAASQPENWHLIYNQVVRMRGRIFTPVDRMGCEKMAEAINPGISQDEPRQFRFQILVSLMLSAQTKDEVNYAAMVRLQNHIQAKGWLRLSIEGVLSCSEAEIDTCIAQVGFHRRKAVYLKRASEMLRDKFGGDVPKTIGDVTALPGVGPKMGYLLLQIAWGINEGIGVDVHLHRLAVQWGWVGKSDSTEHTRLALQRWLPHKYWADINPMLVGFGQTVCTLHAKNCDICTLSAGLCKGADRRMAALEMTLLRRAKLLKLRGDLLGLLDMVL